MKFYLSMTFSIYNDINSFCVMQLIINYKFRINIFLLIQTFILI